ncbi:MAG TPA: NrdH-redoxin [Kosmotogaceae bacterium]|nr:MAG: Glutaredoxin-like protein, YruB-family [Thermotogales bacterium 46_20]HAA85259.1 NrdH-redoxin [Kosmotogaceae bacterium]
MTDKVVVYTSPSCSWCRKLKSYLKAANVSFKEVDVSKDPSKAEELYRKSGQMGVPVTLVGSNVIVGFDKQKIDSLLGIH